jgi:peptidoglycan/LPS O-acetylase OafA/YrhL
VSAVPGNGALGVSIFFVLSGFLITHLLVRGQETSGGGGSIDLKGFYLRRFFRIVPAFYALLLVLAVGQHWRWISVPKPDLLAAALFVTNYAPLHTPEWVGHAWSLCVEEQFYLLWPVLLVIGLRLARSDRARLALGGVTLAGFLASAGWTYHLAAEHAAVMRIAVAPDTRSGALLLGCAVAIWQSVPGSRITAKAAAWGVSLARWGGLALAIAVLWRFPRDDAYSQAWFSPVMALATALVIVAVTAPIPSAAQPRFSLATAVLSLRPMALVGKMSYSLYLYNVLALLLFEFGEQQGWIRVAHGLRPVVAALLALALAYASYRWVEQPFLRRRDRARAHGLVPAAG